MASQAVPGYAARKAYRCPWCQQQVAPGQPHVVAWPDTRTELRRHWHTACWRRHGEPEPPR